MEVLEALRYAHELTDYDGKSLAIVHRDVTPHNIFITYDGQVKLLDFGIAKAATSSVQTATGIIKGKLTYMAPEQSMCDTIDARADLYAVGVMLWEAVTGRRRWPGLSDMAAFARLTSGERPESPDAVALGLPADIDRIVLKALAPKREDRYQAAAEMRADLERIVWTLGASSLRNLGALLQDVFAEDRRRIRQVIEDQFKAMDDRQLRLASETLPTIRPVPGSDSAMHGQLGHRDIGVLSRGHDRGGFPDNARRSRSTGTGITGVVTHTGDRKGATSVLRWRVLVSAVGIMMVVIAAASARRWALSHHSSDPVANAAIETAAAARTPPVEKAPAGPPSMAVAPEPIPVRNEPTVTPAGGAPVSSAKRRSDGPHVRAPDQKAPPSCTVPFYFDETGIKHVKLECLK
jgi:eukaryotic-like serine/threonine-protein kinase